MARRAARGPLYVQFVMGVKNAMPVDRAVFDFYVGTLKRLAPDAEWCGAGIGRDQLTLNEWCVEPAATAAPGSRTTCAVDRDQLAPSNAALVRRAAELCAEYGRPVATPAEARAILGLSAIASGRRLAAGAGISCPPAGGCWRNAGHREGLPLRSPPPPIRSTGTIAGTIMSASCGFGCAPPPSRARSCWCFPSTAGLELVSLAGEDKCPRPRPQQSTQSLPGSRMSTSCTAAWRASSRCISAPRRGRSKREDGQAGQPGAAVRAGRQPGAAGQADSDPVRARAPGGSFRGNGVRVFDTALGRSAS